MQKNLLAIKGKVIRGDNYGKKIGFPTVNLDRRGFLKMAKKPAFGIYAGMVNLSGKDYRAGIVIGPLDKKSPAKGRASLPKIEAHLIGYTGNAYGKSVIFVIKKFIRKFKKFKTEKELILQIRKDLKKC